jgi:hypothetical protein
MSSSDYRFVKSRLDEEIVFMIAKHYFLKNQFYIRNLMFKC